jgi:hypothetical protein
MYNQLPHALISASNLVLAFDVGTTFSGVSYCVLSPGDVPVIRGVARYPAQESIGGDSKISSNLHYDLQGHVRAVDLTSGLVLFVTRIQSTIFKQGN